MMRLRFPSLSLPVMLLSLAVSACNATTVLTPTRSLDRPTDTQLVCALLDAEKTPTLLPLADCNPPVTDDAGTCPDGGADGGTVCLSGTCLYSVGGVCQNPRLFMLITNTDRGQVALANAGKQTPNDPADGGASMIDLDPKSAGFSFLPVGRDPELMRITDLTDHSQTAVTANTGSCDLSKFDVLPLLNIAAGLSAFANANDTLISSDVTEVVPKSGGVPLNARPTWIELAPTSATPMTTTCPSGQCAFVAFPACELVAEIDFSATAATRPTNIVQAIKITRNGPQAPITGAALDSIRCISECNSGTESNSAVDAGVPSDDMSASAGDGGMPPLIDGGVTSLGDGGAAALQNNLPPLVPDSQAFPITFALDRTDAMHVLIVGDAVSATLTMVTLDPTTFALGMPTTITLSGDVGGVERVRLSPRIPGIGDRFLYAIGRDLTVRVVDVDKGQECETNPDNGYLLTKFPINLMSNTIPPPFIGSVSTQLDPTKSTLSAPMIEAMLACLPVGTTPRNPLASTPGISLPGNALPRDVVFIENKIVPFSTTTTAPISAAPNVLLGDFAFIIDSQGRSLAVNLRDLCPEPNISVATTGAPSISAPVWGCQTADVPSSVSTVSQYPGMPVPEAIDFMPNRLRPGNDRYVDTTGTNYATLITSGAPRLATLPTVTVPPGGIVDLSNPISYASTADLCNVTFSSPTMGANPMEGATLIGSGCIAMQSQSPTSTSSAANGPAIPNWDYINFRDPTAVMNENWAINWEGVIPNTVRNTATVDGNTVLDQTASSCSRGVVVGDKLYLTGCVDDTGCSPDQTCFLDPGRQPGAPGLCLNRNTDQNNNDVPDPNIVNNDPNVNGGKIVNLCAQWTQSILHYRIASVTQDPSGASTITLEELPLPEHLADAPLCKADCDCVNYPVATMVDERDVNLQTSCLADGHGQMRCLRACDPTAPTQPGVPGPADCGVGYTCQTSVIDQRSRCMRAPLPPPQVMSQCFSDLQSYEVHGGDSFIATGSASGFLTANFPDPVTHECTAPDDTTLAHLLTGRIPVDECVVDGATTNCVAPCLPIVSETNWLTINPTTPPTPAACLLTPTGDVSHDDRYIKFENPFFDVVVHVPEQHIAPGGADVFFDGGSSVASDCENGGTTGPVDAGVSLVGGVPQNAITHVPTDGTSITFSVIGGFHPLAGALSSDMSAQLPRSGIVGPDKQTIYVTDEGVQTASTGLLGQVIQFFSDTQSSNTGFQVR